MFECSLCGNGNVVTYNKHYEPNLFLCKKCTYNNRGKYKLKSCFICWAKETEFLSNDQYGFICKNCNDFLEIGLKFYSNLSFFGDGESFESGCRGCIFYKGGLGDETECGLLFRILLQQRYNQIEKPEFFWFDAEDITLRNEKAICLRKAL